MAENLGSGGEGLEGRHRQQWGQEEDDVKALGRPGDAARSSFSSYFKTPEPYVIFLEPYRICPICLKHL